jgi:UDP-N-acetyl-D-galactosamine dehydrogenase
VHDPVADFEEARLEYGVELQTWQALPQGDAVVLAVAHQALMSRPPSDYATKIKAGGCFIDVKSQFDADGLRAAGFAVWRL